MTDTAEHWQERMTALQTEITANTQALADAQVALADAKLEGASTSDIVVQLHTLRDEAEALQSAHAEAQTRLQAAHARDMAARQADALKLAHAAAKDRIEAAVTLDKAMVDAEAALVAFRDAGFRHAQHTSAAGRRALSHAKLEAGEPLRGAMLHHAPTFAAIMQTPRTNADLRRPLKDWVSLQTPLEGK